MAGEKRTEKKHPWVWLLTGLVLIAALAAVMAYRAGTLRETEQERLLQENERYSFETGAQQVFAAVDGGVAVGSSTGLQILEKKERGMLVSLLVRGSAEETLPRLQAENPRFAEAIPMTLEEVFIGEMEAVGYDCSNVLS